ncbi:hypothetical protein DID74_02620 [Candidatus Marinamargulisbacteria bacterium SCGC AG-333-B06]|nr:hypothetical protein DID74_02620 [Candidatus Marinamargulisbacteria bacterium SCGC AG-333-B06]
MNSLFGIITILLVCILNIHATTNLNNASKIKACYKNKICFNLEHANTKEKRKKGLMHIKKLPHNQGMIFSWEKQQIISMWMKNTYIPLDMLWLNSNYQIVCVKENTVPFDLTPINCAKKANYVIEVNAGIINQYKIKKKKNFKLSIISEQQ